MLRLTVVVAAALIGVGVVSDRASVAARGDSCPRLSDAARLPVRPGGGQLRGDIDGDGQPDLVGLRYAVNSRASCGFVLVVKTRSGVFAVRVPEWYKPPADIIVGDWPFAEPYLAAVIQLDPHRSQVVVARSHGASVASVSLYGIAGGTLRALGFHPQLYGDELRLFGTIGTGDTNARCRPGGPLIILGRGPTSASGRRWFVTRGEYRLIGQRLWRTRSRTIRSSMRTANALAHRWGMDALPFTGCTVARGRRL